MKKADLSKLPVPGKKAKDPMLDLDAALKDIESEKPDSDMNEHEDMESSDYEQTEEAAAGMDLSSVSDQGLLKELKKRKLA